MENIIRYSSNNHHHFSRDFEEAFHDSKLQYSLRHLTFTGDVSQENLMDALEKSIQVCIFLGINSKHHFKKIYVSDQINQTIQVDWLMSKKGFNLMQIPSLNEEMAKWLWTLAEK